MDGNEMQKIAKMRFTDIYEDKFGITIDASRYYTYLQNIINEIPDEFKNICTPFDTNFGLSGSLTRHDGIIQKIQKNFINGKEISIQIKLKNDSHINIHYKNVRRLILKFNFNVDDYQDIIICDEIRKSSRRKLWIHEYLTYNSKMIIEAENIEFDNEFIG
jgi:hypothetical protein